MTNALHIPSGWGRDGFIVAIPARNEATHLPRALAGLARDEVIRDVIVIANGCTDATARLAASAAHPGLRVAVLETGALAGGVGEARRLGMQAALDAAPRAAILATTDADCVVGPDWGAATLRALDRADVACGRVLPDPVELGLLPLTVRRHGILEDRVSELTAELDGLRAPAAHDPMPRHGQTPGASLAFRTEVYRAAGGFDAVPCHEDRRIVARIEASGGRVARPWGLTVIASCRLAGRAPGGMAETIAARTADQPTLRSEIDRFRRQISQLRVAIMVHRAIESSPPAPQDKGKSDVLSLG